MAALAPEFQFGVVDNPLSNQRKLQVTIMLAGNEVGNFDFKGTIPRPGENLIGTRIEPFFHQGSTIDLGISIEEEYKKQKWSTPMIATMIESIGNRMSDDQLLFIDVDASGGFWEHLGFEKNRYDRDTPRTPEGRGYEAHITLRDLKIYIAHRMAPSGGKRTRRKKKKSKRIYLQNSLRV